MSNWYQEIDSNTVLSQGDFIFNCPIVEPPKEINEEGNQFIIDDYDIVILSQSCDLENNKVDLVLVCPFYTLSDFAETNPQFKSYREKEAARRGNLPGYHLLNFCEFLPHDEFLIVDFKTVFSVSFEFLKQFKLQEDKRISLLSPYKEHLSQAFARFFMRVGLPSGIPRFEKKKQ